MIVANAPFEIMFAWMAIDRTNISGVLTTTFLKDTKMTKDQANTGVSILWLGIVLLEIPSNVSIPLTLRSLQSKHFDRWCCTASELTIGYLVKS